jgi:hypothetical protein
MHHIYTLHCCREKLYNFLYTSYYKGPSTTDQIMEREGLRMVRNNILALKMDPVRPSFC